MRRSTSRSRGLYGIWIAVMRPLRMTSRARRRPTGCSASRRSRRPCPRRWSRSSRSSRCAQCDEVVDLVEVDAAAVPVERALGLAARLGVVGRPQLGRPRTPRRGGRRGPARASRSASPYIGEVSTNVEPASRAARDDVVAALGARRASATCPCRRPSTCGPPARRVHVSSHLSAMMAAPSRRGAARVAARPASRWRRTTRSVSRGPLRRRRSTCPGTNATPRSIARGRIASAS